MIEILIVEDDDIKCSELVSLTNRVLLGTVRIAKSVNSALSCLRERRPSAVILDMSLPAFDFSLDDGGFRHIVFAGRDVLDEIDRLEYDTQVIVVTAYDRFGDSEGATTLEDLSNELRREYPRIYVDSVWYSPLADAWQTKLTALLTTIAAPNTEGK